MNRFYFTKLYNHNRKLFFAILFFTLLTILCNLLGYEATPFFVWGMYSQKENEPAFYNVQQVVINDSTPLDITAGYTPSTRFFLESPLWLYMDIKSNNNIDPSITFLQSKLKNRYSYIKPYENVLFNDNNRVKKFIYWYKKYCEEVSGISIHDLKIVNTRVYFSNQRILKDKSYIAGEWKE